MVDTVMAAYEERAGIKVERKHLVQACHHRRDFVKHVFGWFCTQKFHGEGAKHWFKAYINAVDNG